MASDGNEIAHNLVALAGGDEPSALVAERRFLSLRTREICGLARPFARRGEIALSQGIGNVTGRRCLKDGRINRLHLLGCFGRRLRRIPRPGSRVLPDRIATLARRSEEHTSELQSLMRISYAVFCLKKKNRTSSPTITYVSTY